MRKLLAPFCLLASFSAALAQDAPVETVTSNASALIGVWKIVWPQWGRVGAWGPMADRFCRIERDGDALAIHCFRSGGNTGSAEAGTVSLDGSSVHFAWGNMLLRLVLNGALQSSTEITGHVGVKISRIEQENPTPSNAAKLSLSEAMPDKAGKAALLRTALEQMAKGPLTLPHDAAAIGKTRGALPGDIAALGALQAIVYLGSSSRELPSTRGLPQMEPNFFHVYAAEFASGERVCGLHQREDGVLDAFACV